MKSLKLGQNVTLELGDFIIVASHNYLEYGWYCGTGRNTLQYYGLHWPGTALIEYENHVSGKNDSPWIKLMIDKYKVFNSKFFGKTYITSYSESRVMKVDNPDELFKNSHLSEKYKKSKEALIKIKFLQK